MRLTRQSAPPGSLTNFNNQGVIQFLGSSSAASGSFVDTEFNGTASAAKPTLSNNAGSRSSVFRLATLIPVLLVSITTTAFAGSATWNLNPATSNWNHAANWTPATVPYGPSDTAAFAFSHTTDVFLSAQPEIDGIVFNAGASAFTITVKPALIFTISGSGITNNSGTIQNFVNAANGNGNAGIISFTNSATAGTGTVFTNNGCLVNGGDIGFTAFFDTSTAGSAIFINNGGAVDGADGGRTQFYAGTAGNGTFINRGGLVTGAYGGTTAFNSSTADSATLIANAGLNGGMGGEIDFYENSRGHRARIELFGNGHLDISGHNARGMMVGSIEGDGEIFLGSNTLAVGSNKLDTNFSGVIQDGGYFNNTGGSLTKIGTGKLVLSHRNTYTGGTTVKRGKLIVNNVGQSGTGSGPVQVNGGRLGGKGIIAGAVTVGTGSGRGAVLSPGYDHGTNPGSLTIQSPLTFNSDATYEIEVNSSRGAVDKVIALGVTINSGAHACFADLGNGVFTVGSTFTVINNTSASPILGRFSNLGDGLVFNSNGTNFKVSYTGGTGNDLTLTVVP